MKRFPKFLANPLGHMKSFVHTSSVVPNGCASHVCAVKNGLVNVNHESLSFDRALNVSWDVLSVHHYVTKSQEEFKMKVRRGSVHTAYVSNVSGKLLDYIYDIDSRCHATFAFGKTLYDACCSNS